MVDYKYIVKLWHKTQMGPMRECNKAQAEFAEYMWALYENLQPEIFDEEINKEYKEASARLEDVLLGP